MIFLFKVNKTSQSLSAVFLGLIPDRESYYEKKKDSLKPNLSQKGQN